MHIRSVTRCDKILGDLLDPTFIHQIRVWVEANHSWFAVISKKQIWPSGAPVVWVHYALAKLLQPGVPRLQKAVHSIRSGERPVLCSWRNPKLCTDLWASRSLTCDHLNLPRITGLMMRFKVSDPLKERLTSIMMVWMKMPSHDSECNEKERDGPFASSQKSIQEGFLFRLHDTFHH